MIFTRHTIPNALAAIYRCVDSFFAGDPVVATPFVRDSRRQRCGACRFNCEGQCIKCTCVIELKTQIATESCPIGWWGRQTKFFSGL